MARFPFFSVLALVVYCAIVGGQNFAYDYWDGRLLKASDMDSVQQALDSVRGAVEEATGRSFAMFQVVSAKADVDIGMLVTAQVQVAATEFVKVLLQQDLHGNVTFRGLSAPYTKGSTTVT
eukprot:GGOE01060865.1.p2 GENE.GGOE01060865.1~~GGOE01060865.1.p2  ORF type:complete len:121 (-),score=28.40 GGOE01060865.1:299-661(-)